MAFQGNGQVSLADTDYRRKNIISQPEMGDHDTAPLSQPVGVNEFGSMTCVIGSA